MAGSVRAIPTGFCWVRTPGSPTLAAMATSWPVPAWRSNAAESGRNKSPMATRERYSRINARRPRLGKPLHRAGALDSLALAGECTPSHKSLRRCTFNRTQAVTDTRARMSAVGRPTALRLLQSSFDMLARHAHGFSQRALRQSHRRHEFPNQISPSRVKGIGRYDVRSKSWCRSRRTQCIGVDHAELGADQVVDEINLEPARKRPEAGSTQHAPPSALSRSITKSPSACRALDVELV